MVTVHTCQSERISVSESPKQEHRPNLRINLYRNRNKAKFRGASEWVYTVHCHCSIYIYILYSILFCLGWMVVSPKPKTLTAPFWYYHNNYNRIQFIPIQANRIWKHCRFIQWRRLVHSSAALLLPPPTPPPPEHRDSASLKSANTYSHRLPLFVFLLSRLSFPAKVMTAMPPV